MTRKKSSPIQPVALNPPTPPLQDFMVLVSVLPKPGTRPDDFPLGMIGFYQRLGVRVKPNGIKDLLDNYFPGLCVDWQHTELERVSMEDVDLQVLGLVTHVEREGVWWTGSKHYFENE